MKGRGDLVLAVRCCFKGFGGIETSQHIVLGNDILVLGQTPRKESGLDKVEGDQPGVKEASPRCYRIVIIHHSFFFFFFSFFFLNANFMLFFRDRK